MNVLKTFDNETKAKRAALDFAQDNLFSIESVDPWGRVKLVTGHRVHFFVINTIEDAYLKISGECYSWVEFNGTIEQKTKEFIWSRVRECKS